LPVTSFVKISKTVRDRLKPAKIAR
jgi:hypothetical protein